MIYLDCVDNEEENPFSILLDGMKKQNEIIVNGLKEGLESFGNALFGATKQPTEH
jgi:hypothetical protein